MSPTSTALDRPSSADLAGWVRESRARILELVADLSDEQLDCPMLATVNPLLWEIGHQGWFQERLVLRQGLGEAPLLGHADALWDSAAVPHDTRWYLRLPPRPEVLSYLSEVAERVAARVEAPDATDVVRHLARYAVHHEDWHIEALTYTRQTLGYPPPPPDGHAGQADAGEGGPLPGDVAVPGGRFLLGALRSEPFVFDNEKWAHPCELSSFVIGRAPVSQSEFAAFVDDGGYRRRELWGDDGWSWRVAAEAEGPAYWRRAGQSQAGRGKAAVEGWERRHFDRWIPLEPHRPMLHASWFEAMAYCRWAGRRLPSEAEWEAAAIGAPAGAPAAAGALSFPDRRLWPWGDGPLVRGRANLDGELEGTVDVAAYPDSDSGFGCRQMLGNVWEWTSSVFLPFPGFERDAYKENSEPWFGSRFVLRGGSWATPARLVRPTLRNYFTPDRRDVYAGFRTVALS